MLRKTRTVTQEYDKSVSRVSGFVDTIRIYLFGWMIWEYVDTHAEEVKEESKTNIGFGKQ